MGILKNIWRRFRGGPDFTYCNEVTAILEDKQLTLTVPASNIQAVQLPQPINFPYLQSDWFESQAEHSRQHHYVHIITKGWCYLGLSLMLSELGVLWLQARIKRIPADQDINAKNLNALGSYLIHEYDAFYNYPIFCNQDGFFPDGSKCEVDGFIGLNTRRKSEIEKEIRDAWSKELTEAELQAKIKDRIPPPNYPPLQPHQIKSINGQDWVFYYEQQRNVATRENYYNLPLDEQYYLQVSFRHSVDWCPKYNLWKKHAEEAEQKIMQMVKIEDYLPAEIGETEPDSSKLLDRA